MGWLHNELWQYVGPARARSYNHWQAHCHIFGPTMGWGTLAGSHWLGHTGWAGHRNPTLSLRQLLVAESRHALMRFTFNKA
ncbi:hypothetical protein [Alteromonas lipotrueae]|uniref:hypothetical protein n=1 Tax=Alteromonas lipotrueae TaxID=2803814 RepID=UPI001C44DCA8|nr:hypothetical protein [Alteromonas lipotrueae]